MAGQDLNRSIKIYIDGSDAAQGIQPVQEAIGKLEQKLAALNNTEADYEEKSEQLKKQLESKHRTLANYQKKVEETERVLKNLSGATYKELLAVQKNVRAELQNAVPGTEKYTRALEQNRRVSAALVMAQREMRTEVGSQTSLFSRSADVFNQYSGIVAGAVASATGLTFAMRSSVEEYAKMQEAESQVIKYTGMTKDEVAALNEELKKMDTRTARDKLNELAGDAGRLGITSREGVMEFIDAADKINVALGEDLGDEAVGNIGKLAKMFGEDERMGLRGAMLATGSAINEVAQNSSAAERYLVDFTARVAGVANQAGIAQSDIIGFAASMDENMLRNETSATAYQNILLKMMTDTEKFAKVAGLSLKEFSELVRTDANEALLVFAKALSDKGGMADLAPIFGDLQTEGAGVASVLAVLAGKADEVRERQELANKAYHDGTSILKEFDVQNNTVQAGLDKARKGFTEVSVELGEHLLPLMSNMISGTSLFVRSLLTVINVCGKYSYTLMTLTAMVGGYVLAIKAEVAWQKLTVLWNEKIVVSLKKVYATLVAHPWMAVGVAVGTLVAYFYDLSRATSDVSRNQRMLDQAMNEACTSAQNERREIETLINVARDKAASDDARLEAIKKLNEISPEYLGNLSLENINTTEADTAIKRYTSSLLANAKAKALNAKIDELEREKQHLRDNPDEATRWYDPLTTGAARVFSDAERVGRTIGTLFSKGTFDGWNEQTQMQQRYATSTLEAFGNRYQAEMKRINDSQKMLQEELEKVMKESLETTDGGSNNEPKPTSTTPVTATPLLSDEEELKAKKEALRQAISEENVLYQQQLNELTAAYVNHTDENLKTYEDYQDARDQLEVMHLERMLEITGLDKEARTKIEGEILAYKLKCQKEFEDAQEKSSKKQKKELKEDNRELENEFKNRYGTMKAYTDQFGTALGQVIAGQKSALQALGDVMVDIIFDVLDEMIQAQLNELAVKAATATAEGSMKEISSKGIAGIGTSAAIAAAVSGLLMTAKTALKAMMGKRPSSPVGDGSTGTSQRVAVPQYAAGRYDVLGEDDHQLYRDVPYIGPAPSGIITRPALISESGAELIINADDLRRLQQHINYPLVLQAITEARRGYTGVGEVKQYAKGSRNELPEPAGTAVPVDLLVKMYALLEDLQHNGVSASVMLSDFERKQKLRDRARKIGSKNN